jgi:Fe-S cluster assembly protein SufD
VKASGVGEASRAVEASGTTPGAEATAGAEEETPSSLDERTVESLSQGAPSWLSERRRHAWSVFENTPLPSTRSEEWRYTDVSRVVDFAELRLATPGTVTDDDSRPARLEAAMDEDRAASGHTLLIDGAVVHVDLDPALEAQGVVLTSLKSAVHDHGDLLEELLATEVVPPEDGKFQALNAALWTDGVLLYVPANVKLDLPVRATRWISEAGSAVCTRTLIVAEPGSQVSYVEELLSEDFERRTLASSAVEIIARDGAQVQYVSIQRLGRGAFSQSAQRTLAYRDSRLDTLNVNLGGSVTRLDLNARLLGPGAHSDMLGLYFGDDDQHFDHNTSQDHVAPETGSDLLYKGALDESSRAAFRGIIRVHPGAQGTDAYQTNRNLLLSEEARADSLPNLEIEADDVKCSHGASVGQLDSEAIFYLLSRGLNLQQAERLVVLGFLGDVLARLPLGGVVEKVTRAIERKLKNV